MAALTSDLLSPPRHLFAFPSEVKCASKRISTTKNSQQRMDQDAGCHVIGISSHHTRYPRSWFSLRRKRASFAIATAAAFFPSSFF